MKVSRLSKIDQVRGKNDLELISHNEGARASPCEHNNENKGNRARTSQKRRKRVGGNSKETVECVGKRDRGKI